MGLFPFVDKNIVVSLDRHLQNTTAAARNTFPVRVRVKFTSRRKTEVSNLHFHFCGKKANIKLPGQFQESPKIIQEYQQLNP